MAKNFITAKELIDSGINGEFDPMNINTHEVQEIASMLPKDGQIDINMAEILATKYLYAANLCTNIMGIFTAYVGKLETQKKKAYSRAALVKSKDAGIKTDKSRAWFAEMDDDYVNACNKCDDAKGFLKWASSMHESFLRSHYMCKDLLKREYDQERSVSWEGDTEKVMNFDKKHESDDDYNW